jgi:hypothetical protein
MSKSLSLALYDKQYDSTGISLYGSYVNYFQVSGKCLRFELQSLANNYHTVTTYKINKQPIK